MARLSLSSQLGVALSRVAILSNDIQHKEKIIQEYKDKETNAYDCVEVDFDYIVAVSIYREDNKTVIKYMPDRTVNICSELKFTCSPERHKHLVEEFNRFKTKKR